MATLVSDNFDRANSTNVLGSPQIGPAPVVRAGTFGVNANRLYNSVVGSPVSIATWDVEPTDGVRIQATHATVTSVTPPGLVFGYVSATNYFFLEWAATPPNDLTLVQRTSAGTNRRILIAKTLAQYTATDTIAVGYQPSSFTWGVYHNGILAGTLKAVDAQDRPANATSLGVRLIATSQACDDLLIEDWAPPAWDENAALSPNIETVAGADRIAAAGFPYRGRDTRAQDQVGVV